MYSRLLFALMGLLATASVSAQTFDWALLRGHWGESTQFQYACRPDGLQHRFEVSADKKRITWKLDRSWKINTGEEVREYAASVETEVAPNVLIIRYGPELQGLTEEMREWELRFIGPGAYRWRATAWPQGQYNEVIGIKCSD
jgi:hypothetical protein